jgi:hypothetical protein
MDFCHGARKALTLANAWLTAIHIAGKLDVIPGKLDPTCAILLV